MIAARRILAQGTAAAGRRVRHALASERDRRVAAWIAAGYDKTLRLDYDLDETSVVVDAGGFEGQWASDLYARYRCRIYVVEPVAAFADGIQRRFDRNPDISVHAVALGGRTGETEIVVHGTGSSIFGEARHWGAAAPRERVRVVRVADFLAEHGIERLDLLKLNIEGAEYDLLDDLIGSGVVQRVANLQVQFHEFVVDAPQRMRAIHEALRRTHKPTYQAEWVWENWTLREPS
jgi:FkbM family methyltransferase